jgi:hypothetical protein
MRISKLATRLRKPRALREYQDAMDEHRLLARYLRSSFKALPKAEYALLSEFVLISKRKCRQLKKALERPTGKQLSSGMIRSIVMYS